MRNDFLEKSKGSYDAITAKSPVLIVDAKILLDNGVSWQEFLSFVKPKGLMNRHYGKLDEGNNLGLPAGSAVLIELVSGYDDSVAILQWCISCGIKEMPLSVDVYQLTLFDLEKSIVSAVYMAEEDEIVEHFIMHVEEDYHNKVFMDQLSDKIKSFDIDLESKLFRS